MRFSISPFLQKHVHYLLLSYHNLIERVLVRSLGPPLGHFHQSSVLWQLYYYQCKPPPVYTKLFIGFSFSCQQYTISTYGTVLLSLPMISAVHTNY